MKRSDRKRGVGQQCEKREKRDESFYHLVCAYITYTRTVCDEPAEPVLEANFGRRLANYWPPCRIRERTSCHSCCPLSCVRATLVLHQVTHGTIENCGASRPEWRDTKRKERNKNKPGLILVEVVVRNSNE